jgi:hypothetical protein
MKRLLRPLWFALALLFLAEAWLWSHLAPIVRAAVAAVALPAVRTRLARAIESLPPVATLFVFLVPVVLLFPLKLLGLWMLARGSWLGAMAVLGLAKVVSMGVTAFIFEITRPKLLQLAWFRWLYERVLRGLDWAHRKVDPFKAHIRAWVQDNLGPLRRRLRSLFWLMRPRRSGRFLRRVLRIRRRVQRPVPLRS